MADNTLEVDLRVLSQLPEPHDILLIGPLSPSCSLAELKQKIRDLLPSTPPTERQRLIFRGRPLTRETDTLLDIFGDDLVRQGERQTLHLVLREPPIHHDAQSQTTVRPPPTFPPVPAPVPSVASVTFPPGNMPGIQVPVQSVLQQTPFAADQTRRQGSPNSAQMLQQRHQLQHQQALQAQQRAHEAMRQLTSQVPGQPLTPFQIPGGPAGNNTVVFHPPQFLHPQPQFLHPQPQFLHPQPQFLHPQFQHGPQGQAFNVSGHVHNTLPHGHEYPPGSQPPIGTIQPNADFTFPSLPHPPAAAGQPAQSQTETIHHNGDTPASDIGASAARTVTMQANDPQAAMLGIMEGVIASMGVPPEGRERLRSELARNFASQPQAAAAAGPRPSSGHESNGIQSNPLAEQDTRVNNGTVPQSQNHMLGQSTTRHGVGPNGQRFTTTINVAAGTIPLPGGLPPGFMTPHAPPPTMNFMPFPSAQLALGHPHSQHTAPWGWLGPIPALDNMARLQRDLEALTNTSATTTGNPVPSRLWPFERRARLQSLIQQRNQAQSAINAVLRGGPPSGLVGPTAHHVEMLQSMNTLFRRGVDRLTRELDQSETRQVQHPTPQSSSAPQSAAPQNEVEASSQSDGPSSSVVAYLLSSPTGPHAVVYTPRGVFRSVATVSSTPSLHNGLSATRTTNAAGLVQQHPGGLPATNLAPGVPAVPAAPGPAALPVQQQLVLQQPLQGQQAPVANAEVNGMVIALTPFFRTFWFFTRVLAFFWLFGGLGGGAVRRVLLTTVLSIFYHFYQAGALREHQAWLIQRWERLIGVHEPVHPPAGREGAAAAGMPGPQPAHGAPQPEQAAQRLMNERRRRDRGWAMAQARAVQRTIALFMASLYPGIGERHVAERERVIREAAEAARAQVAAAEAAAASPSTETAASSTTAPVEQQQTSEASSSEPAPVERTKSSNVVSEITPQSDEVTEGSSSSVAVRDDGEGQLTERRKPEQ